MNIDCLLFDNDGTLINSMPLHYKAYKLAFQEIGLELSDETFYTNCAGIGKDTIKKCIGNQKCEVPILDIHKRKLEIYSNILDTETIELLEFAKLLPILYDKFPLALVSSGNKENIYKVLNKLDLRKYFSIIITGGDVQCGKPSPEPFLLAAKLLNIAPENCMAVGDTDDDKAGAIAAKMSYFDIRMCSTNKIFF